MAKLLNHSMDAEALTSTDGMPYNVEDFEYSQTITADMIQALREV